MKEYNKETIDKIIKLFIPRDEGFLNFKSKECIYRAIFGFDTNFLIQWLVEDYGFSDDEAKWFVEKVRELHKDD